MTPEEFQRWKEVLAAIAPGNPRFAEMARRMREGTYPFAVSVERPVKTDG